MRLRALFCTELSKDATIYADTLCRRNVLRSVVDEEAFGRVEMVAVEQALWYASVKHNCQTVIST